MDKSKSKNIISDFVNDHYPSASEIIAKQFAEYFNKNGISAASLIANCNNSKPVSAPSFKDYENEPLQISRYQSEISDYIENMDSFPPTWIEERMRIIHENGLAVKIDCSDYSNIKVNICKPK